MNPVFIKVSYDILEMPNFFRKLKRFVGYFRIESQDFNDSLNGVITISFSTNKVKIKEGGSRQVDIEAKSNSRGSWYFTSINSY